MKKVGIVGGLGPASTIDYYNGIINDFRKMHGDDVYPEIVIDSINMNKIITALDNKAYAAAADIIVRSIDCLAAAGADFAVISANTPHIVWDLIKDRTKIPVISIIEETCDYVKANDYKIVVVFGTKFTMRSGLYDDALKKYGIAAVVPNDEDIEELGNIIYPNLENGIVIEADKQRMIEIAEKYIKASHADALLLGCTEIPLMIKQGDVSVPVIDTTRVHIDAIGHQINQ